MRVSYNKLWKLLIDRGMTRTELRQSAGFSTSALSKLGKDKHVSTEILVSICDVLCCELSDIMELVTDEEGGFFGAFKRQRKLIDENELVTTYRMEYDGEVYVIRMTKKSAGKHSVITCASDSVGWEQIYPSGISPAREYTFLSKREFFDRGERGIFVVSGKPMCITGLDEGGFVSAKNEKRKDGDLIVMSEAVFENFEPTKKDQ